MQNNHCHRVTTQLQFINIIINSTFNIQQFYVLPTLCIYVFCVGLRTNSDYFPININRLIFVTEKECLLRGTD